MKSSLTKVRSLFTFVIFAVLLINANPASGVWGTQYFRSNPSNDRALAYVSGYRVVDGPLAVATKVGNADVISEGVLKLNLNPDTQEYSVRFGVLYQPYEDAAAKPWYISTNIEMLILKIRVLDQTTNTYLNGNDIFVNQNPDVKIEGGSDAAWEIMTYLIGKVNGYAGYLFEILGNSYFNYYSYNHGGNDKGVQYDIVFPSLGPIAKKTKAIHLRMDGDLKYSIFNQAHDFKFEYSVYAQIALYRYGVFYGYEIIDTTYNYYIQNYVQPAPTPTPPPPTPPPTPICRFGVCITP